MDLLHKRYASPFLFLDELIEHGYFTISWVLEFWDLCEEEKLWQLYLRTQAEKSFADWKAEIFAENNIQSPKEKQNVEVQDVEATIREAEQILCNFVPEGGESWNSLV